MIEEIENLPDVSFIDNVTLDDIQAQLIEDYKEKYKELTGKESHITRSDPEALILYACSIQIYQTMLFVDRAGKQDLLKYSYGGYLDNLAALKGIKREEAKPAVVMVRFTLSAIRPSVVAIPAGTRVTNGEIYFMTDEYAEIRPGGEMIDVQCTCESEGEIGNGIPAGEINILVDPIAYVASAVSTEESGGGTDIESDDSLAERVYIAPSKYSVAGPEEAYKYWIKTFNSSISDVYIGNSDSGDAQAGEVLVEFILDGGVLPGEALIRSLEDFLANENIRPLTDKVIVKMPNVVEYDINLTYYINKSDSAHSSTIRANVEAAVEEYKLWQCSKIGRDINPTVLTRVVQEAGAKRVVITLPVFTVIPNTDIAKVRNCTITYGGIEHD